MSDYEHSATVRASADALFDYLADVDNLPNYFESMASAEPHGEGDVHVVAEVEGHTREGEAWVDADRSTRTMRWGSEGPSRYHGELTVSDVDPSTSTVAVSLHTEHADGPGIRAGLEQTLANIKQHFEGSSTETTR